MIRQYERLTHCLLVSSAHNLCKQIGSRSGPTERWAWSESKLTDTDRIYERIFTKKLILKTNSADDKKAGEDTRGQRVKGFY